MGHSRLSQTRQSFVHTVNYNIRAKLSGGHRKIIRKMKMSPMCLVYNQRHTMIMSNLRNPRYIRYNSIICRRSNQYCFYFRILSQIHFHTAWRNSTVYPQLRIFVWINIRHLEIPQICRMINRFMAVSGDQNLSASAYSRRHCCQNRPGTSINTVKTLRHTIEPGNILLGPFQEILRMM